ncbi:MAG: hypothetical protein WAS26_07180, partial [Paracoccaceae bacterium]
MKLPLSDFRPVPKLVTTVTPIAGPSLPFIDAHNHLGQFGGGWDKRPPQAFFDHLQTTGCLHYVDLDGGWGEEV